MSPGARLGKSVQVTIPLFTTPPIEAEANVNPKGISFTTVYNSLGTSPWLVTFTSKLT